MKKRILITRLSALGDTVLTLPLLFTIREFYPDAYIGWVVEEKSASLLKDIRDIDKLHILKMSDKSIKGYYRIGREISKEKYDYVLDAQGLTKSAIIGFFAGIKNRIGFKRAPLEAREISPLLNNRLISPPSDITHIALRSQYLAGELGIKAPYTINRTLPLAESSLKAMRDWWNKNELGSRVIVFGVGTSWITKIWPVEYMNSIVDIALDANYKVVVTWGPDEQKNLQKWRNIFSEGVLWSPETKSVSELAALISLGACYAGPDSAPLHIAWMLRKPTFSWFGPSSSERGAPPSEKDEHIIAHSPTRKRQGNMMWGLKPEVVAPKFNDWLCRFSN